MIKELINLIEEEIKLQETNPNYYVEKYQRGLLDGLKQALNFARQIQIKEQLWNTV